MATLGARVSPDVYDIVCKEAAKAGVKVSKFVEIAVTKLIEDQRTGGNKNQATFDLRVPMGMGEDEASKHREIVLEALKAKGPMTKFEIAAKLGWDEHWVSPRLTELKKKGIVRVNGKRLSPRSKKKCFVWEVCQ